MRVLDLFCCEGGAAKGYHDAGFEVVGVDLLGKFAKRYPHEFHQGDAIEFVKEHGHEFDLIHASPPCQAYTRGNAGKVTSHPMLIPATREALVASGKPYIIENVEDARPHLVNPIMLCGSMFDLKATDTDGTPLRMERHRLFESNLDIHPPMPDHHDRSIQVAGAYGGARKDKWEAKHIRRGGYVPAKEVQQELLGIDWMTLHGLHQSLPPVYTEWLGLLVRDYIEV